MVMALTRIWLVETREFFTFCLNFSVHLWDMSRILWPARFITAVVVFGKPFVDTKSQVIRLAPGVRDIIVIL